MSPEKFRATLTNEMPPAGIPASLAAIRTMPDYSLEKEWEEMVKTLLRGEI